MLIKDIIDTIAPKTTNLYKLKTDTNISNIEYRLENVSTDTVFFAYKGASFDSVNQAIELYKQGKILLIVTDRVLDNDIDYLIVDNVRAALSILSQPYFNNPLASVKSIAITGTNGKTTISYILESICTAYGRSVVKIGTNGIFISGEFFENNLTTPSGFEVARYLNIGINKGCNYLISEVSSHALDQRRIEGLEFDIAVFTNLTGDHLDYHKDMDTYFLSKARLFTDKLSKDKIINISSDYGLRLVKLVGKEAVTYSIDKKSDISVKNYNLSINGIEATITLFNQPLEIKSSLIGRHNLENILAAATVAKLLNIPDNIISKGIESLKTIDGRLERVADDNVTIFIDYAHTDDALSHVLNSLIEIKTHRIITVFGCGGDRDQSKRHRMGKVATSLSDITIITTDNPRSEMPAKIIEDIMVGVDKSREYFVEEDRSRAIHQAINISKKGDIILIAGKGHEKYQIIGDKKIYFDDHAEVKRYLQQLA